MEKIMTVEEIMAAIPNRFPIYYLDAVTEFEDEKHITAVKNLTMNEDFFQGYFPGEPIMPGTLIVEALAQAGSLLILKSAALGENCLHWRYQQCKIFRICSTRRHAIFEL